MWLIYAILNAKFCNTNDAYYSLYILIIHKNDGTYYYQWFTKWIKANIKKQHTAAE